MKRLHDVKKFFPAEEVRTTGANALETEQIPTSPASNITTNRSTPRRYGCKARLKRANLRVTVPLRGHLGLCQSVLILVVNLILPGVGTMMLACMINERLYLSDTALELVKRGEFNQEYRGLI